MVTAKEAYYIFKGLTGAPYLTHIMVDKDYYASSSTYDNDRIAVVDKETGGIKHLPYFHYWDLYLLGNPKYVYVKELYDDVLEYYKEHKDEETLASIYQVAQFNCWATSKNDENEDMFLSHDDYKMIARRWKEMENYLYSEIRSIIDNEDIDYPPCVLNKWDDPFYRIKPFMIRNGYTDCSRHKFWERLKD